MSAQIKIPFNALPEHTRQRVVQAIAGDAQPAPLHTVPTSKVGAFIGWTLVLLLAVGAVFIGSAERFGSLYEVRQPFPFILGYAAAFFIAAYAFFAMVRRVLADKFTPFRRGIYLFPTDLVDASSATLTIWPLNRIDRVDVVHHHTNGVYGRTAINFAFQGGGRQTVTIIGKAKSQTLLDNLAHHQRMIGEAARAGNIEEVRRLDLFFDARTTAPWTEPSAADRAVQHASGLALASTMPLLLKWASVSALVVGLLVGGAAWGVRNMLSDSAAFTTARQRNTAESFRDYLGLQDQYGFGNPDHGTSYEAEARELLFSAAFAEAQAEGSVTALRDYMQTYPNSPHAALVQPVIHQRFETVKAAFLAQASMVDPGMPQFMEHLLNWLEAHNSPPVQVRFDAPSSETLAQTDASLAAEHSNVSPITPHFTQERMAMRESGITDVLSRGFATVFPNDVMSMTHVGRVSGPAAVPTFDIHYEVTPSGTTFTNESTGQEFVGIHVNFLVTMHIPDSVESHQFTLNVAPPHSFSVSFQDRQGAASDSAVYSTMARLAFERLTTQVALTFFRPGTAAYTEAAGALAAEEAQQRGTPAANGCNNTCNTANDNECDDGGPDSLYDVCAFGTDCADCGPRTPGATAPPQANNRVPAANGCDNTCNTSNDNECDDGGPDSLYNVCALGTDCADCGPRPPVGGGTAIPVPAPTVPVQPATGGRLCTNTCNTSNDNECDDGGPNSLYNVCALGTDCGDCGPR